MYFECVSNGFFDEMSPWCTIKLFISCSRETDQMYHSKIQKGLTEIQLTGKISVGYPMLASYIALKPLKRQSGK